MTKKTNVQLLENQPIGDYSRKPYMVGKEVGDLSLNSYLRGADGGSTYRALMGRESYSYMERAVAEYLEHSQFKKPYMGDEFPEMEFFGNPMQFMNYNEWDRLFRPGDGVEIPQCFSVCDIKARGFALKKQSETCPNWTEVTWDKAGKVGVGNPVEDIYYVWQYKRILTGSGYQYIETDWLVEPVEYESDVWIRASGRQGFKIHAPASTLSSKEESYVILFAQPDPWNGTDCEHHDTWDPDPSAIGKETGCSHMVVINWCEPECQLVWTGDDTILQGINPVTFGTATASIAETEDPGPFNWSIDISGGIGEGLSLEFAQTAGLENTVRATDVACGYGIITVSGSKCVYTVGTIRVADGDSDWVFISGGQDAQDTINENGWDGSYGSVSGVWPTWVFEKIIGEYKIWERIQVVATSQFDCGTYDPWEKQHTIAEDSCDWYWATFVGGFNIYCCPTPFAPSNWYHLITTTILYKWQCV